MEEERHKQRSPQIPVHTTLQSENQVADAPSPTTWNSALHELPSQTLKAWYPPQSPGPETHPNSFDMIGTSFAICRLPLSGIPVFNWEETDSNALSRTLATAL
jgi:hypothetical protein